MSMVYRMVGTISNEKGDFILGLQQFLSVHSCSLTSRMLFEIFPFRGIAFLK